MTGPVQTTVASYGQERVWLASQLSRDVPTYHVADRFEIHADVSFEQIGAAFATLAARHPSLRTALLYRGGGLCQAVHARIEPPVRAVDLSGVEEEKQAEACDGLADELMYAGFDLERPPLWRAAAVLLGAGVWRVLFVAHHTVCDPASLLNIHAELTELCVAAEQGRDPVLPHLPRDYAGFALAQRDRLAAAPFRASAEFWARSLAGSPAVHGIPTDRPRPAGRTFAGAEVWTELPASVPAAAAALVGEEASMSFTVLLAAFAALAHRRSGADDVVVGVPVAGRDHSELLPMVGTFVNMVVLRVSAAGDPAFAEFADRVRRVWTEARAHREMPFQHVVELVAAGRSAAVPPVYQLGFNMPADRGPGRPSTTAEDDLLLEVTGRRVRLEYNTALFEARTARGLLEDFAGILVTGVGHPDARLSELPGAGPAPAAAPVAPRRPAFLAPRTAAELAVARVWAEVLGRDRIGAADGFFELGGHSLQALRVLARLSEEYGTAVTAQAFFTHPTVAGLAAELDRLRPGRTP